MSTFYTFLYDPSLLATMKENIANALLNNIKVQVSTPSNPSGTTSTSPVQMGLGITYTPSTTGRLLIIVTGEAANNTAGDGATVQLSYGTGSSPSNGASATGTAIGSKISVTSNAASQTVPVTLGYVLTGLTVGTSYWFDLQVAAITGGTASVSNLTVLIIEF
ncbi:MAG: hypothetical protein QXU98_07805 [Candidatus Parvarchaeota archaeon]